MLEVGDDASGFMEEDIGNSRFSAHTLRVSMISLLIGRELELNEESLQDLGVCAMFHDVGYAFREERSQPKDQPAVPGFAPPFERHASAGCANDSPTKGIP